MNRIVPFVVACTYVIAPDARTPALGGPWHASEPHGRAEGLASMRDALDIFGPPALLASPVVHEALALTAAQKAKVFELADQSQKQHRAGYVAAHKAVIGVPNIRKGENGGLSPVREAIASSMAKTRKECLSRLGGLLDQDQFDRFWKMALQVGGDFAVTWPEIQDRLNMTPDQRDRVQTVLQNFRSAQGKIRAGQQRIYQDITKRSRGSGADREFADETRLKVKFSRLDELHSQEDELRDKASRSMLRMLERSQKRKLENCSR